MTKKKKSRRVKYADSDFYFHDCPVCTAMRAADEKGRDLTESELKLAFKEAKAHGAVVGGSLIEDEDRVN